MMESAVVIDIYAQPIYWHLPAGRSAGHIPDSRDLWEVLWENRETVWGIAHTHPGSGRPSPSQEDVTTFSAVEKALGKRLIWWILTADELQEYKWFGPKDYDYATHCIWNERQGKFEPGCLPSEDVFWVKELRKASYGPMEENDECDPLRGELIELEMLDGKPQPYISYNWDAVHGWLLEAGLVNQEDLWDFEVYIQEVEEFGFNRGFSLLEENLVVEERGLNGIMLPTEMQANVIRKILEHFGEHSVYYDQQIVNFGGR